MITFISFSDVLQASLPPRYDFRVDEWAAGLSMSLASSDGSETNKRKILDFVKAHIRLCATDSKAESLRYVTILLGCPTLLLAAQIHFRSDNHILAGDQFNFNCYHFVV